MNCAVCGSPLSQTRCGRNSKRVCPRGHPQPSAPSQETVARKAVEEQGIGE
jgi:hypothetical protein